MIVPQPVVGCTIDARCTRCRKNLPHTVVSLKKNHLERVRCSVCDWEHVYRATVQPKGNTGQKVAENNDWKELQSTHHHEKAAAYSISGKYTPESWINHPTLGLGLVRKVTGEHTIEVLFETGPKLMRCNGGLR